MVEPVVIGPCTLYLGDCLEVLPTLGQVDAVVTDPPFAIRNTFGVQKRLDGSRKLQFGWDGAETRDEVLQGVGIACELSQSFFTFCGASQVSFIELMLESAFTVKPAVWVKACPPPAMPGNWWPSGFEYALYGYRPGAPFFDDDTSRRNVFYSDTYRSGIRVNEKVDHPTQKWLPLIIKIVESILPRCGLALDPFMGSGTTGVACIRTERRFIGIEKEPKYFDIACRRIERAWQDKKSELPFEKPKPEVQRPLITE